MAKYEIETKETKEETGQLITDNYRELNRTLHGGELAFGAHGERWAKVVRKLRKEHDCVSVLDYGCGKGGLGIALGNPDWFR